ncbi:SurA N-terminal domain-containing protein [Desulforhopalus singaporensis]|uniref:Periplasmic chaperone PpiD n=1 Tax=Desulforhopalus singaporensis TaxID=91360 RepID=A0A1H0K451_9BACT|nr:SurA N-terminal domain-containing protein [Desulforhopalus singaporensis]SDO50542.1 peptidyl-prolyl cis-trans isomerase D [Desulforhopalus singaporensis]
MLQFLRKKAQSTIIQIIVVVIALVFIFWGVGTNLRGDRQSALKINDEEISFQEFQRAYDRAYEQMSNQFGGNIPKGLAEALNIKQQVINQLIQTSLLRQGAAAMGIHVSDEEVRLAIEDMVQFQDDGRFSIEKYKTVLAANRMAPTKFEASMKVDRLSQMASREVANFVAIATDFEIEDLYSRINEKIDLQYITVEPSRFEDKVEINDTLLTDWFATVKDNYKTEPQIKLKYLTFTYDTIGRKIEVEDAKVEEYYRANLNDFKVAEQRRARHIIFQAGPDDSKQVHQEKKQEAEAILKRAKDGEDFAELAAGFSEGPSRQTGGDLGFFTKESMVPPFSDAVFSLAPGQISDVVKTQFGYHVIKLEEIKPAATKPLAAVKEQIVAILQQKEAQRFAFQLANSAYEGIIGAGSLDKYGENNKDAEIKESDFFARENSPDQLGKDPKFLQQIFALNKSELSSLVKGDTGYGIFFIEDMIEPTIPEFKVIKDTLAKDFRVAESKNLAKAEADKLLEQLKNGKELAVIGTENNYEVHDSGPLTQNGQNNESEFPESLINNGFLLSSTSPYPDTPGMVDDTYYVYLLSGRELPKMKEDEDDAERIRQVLLQYKRQQLLTAWLQNLEAKAQITRHASL